VILGGAAALSAILYAARREAFSLLSLVSTILLLLILDIISPREMEQSSRGRARTLVRWSYATVVVMFIIVLIFVGVSMFGGG
jgi:uncharacterized membrane protein